MRIILYLIKSYQRVSRCIFPQACRFTPSCSQYAFEAIEKYGVGKGVYKAMLRILRCSPLFQGGDDPIR